MKGCLTLIFGLAGGLLFVGLIFSAIIGTLVNKELNEREPMKPTAEVRQNILENVRKQKAIESGAEAPDYLEIAGKKVPVKKAQAK